MSKLNYPHYKSLNTVIIVIDEAKAAINNPNRIFSEIIPPMLLAELKDSKISIYNFFTKLNDPKNRANYSETKAALKFSGWIILAFVIFFLILVFAINNTEEDWFRAISRSIMCLPIAFYFCYRQKKALRSKKILLKDSAKSIQTAIISSLDKEPPKERLDYLQKLNILLQAIINDLDEDLARH